MTSYIGVKLINAKPMTRLEYNQLRGWELPSDENGSDKGFLVEYIDVGKANHPDFSGYISWSPKDVFEAAYRVAEGEAQALTFGDAIHFMKQGKKVARTGWNGKGMWLGLVRADNYIIPVAPYGDGECPVSSECSGLLPWIGMKTAANEFVPWLASQTDMLAEDWQIVE